MIKSLIRLFIIFGLIYVFFISFIPDNFKMLLKLIPMIIVIFIAISITSPNSQKYKFIIITALLFCAIGDYTLQWFQIGLISFLVGHLFYIYAFSTILQLKKLTKLQYFLIIYGITMIGIMGGTLFYEGETILATMVIVYIIVIVTMGLTAISTKLNLATIGALLFIFSDSILAMNKFITSVPFSHQLIMLSYYSAQLLLALSIKSYAETLSEHSTEVNE